MNFLRPVLLACAGLALLSPLAATANPQAKPAETPSPREEAGQSQGQDQSAEEATGDDKRICRYVKLDASSRRKTKVCRTVEEWRELNNIR
jgi:hypothetical protein